ncbi:MAG: putative toxin-antitoxin system toxin component, PIN family [Patescibacteria group bacterium]
MLVVFDSNVLVSAFLWQKKLKPIYSAIRSGGVQPCFSPETWAEFQRVLRYKKLYRQLEKIGLAPEEISRLLAGKARFFIPKEAVSVIMEDPSDNALLSVTLAASAKIIVSGDKHLLTLKTFRDISIVTPVEFIKQQIEQS